MRQHQIEQNWRAAELRSPKVSLHFSMFTHYVAPDIRLPVKKNLMLVLVYEYGNFLCWKMCYLKQNNFNIITRIVEFSWSFCEDMMITWSPVWSSVALVLSVALMTTHSKSGRSSQARYNTDSMFMSLTSITGILSEWVLFYSSVLTDLGGSHRRGVVFPDGGQHHHQRLNRQNSQGVECRHRPVCKYIVRTHLYSQVYAPPQKHVSRWQLLQQLMLLKTLTI